MKLVNFLDQQIKVTQEQVLKEGLTEERFSVKLQELSKMDKDKAILETSKLLNLRGRLEYYQGVMSAFNFIKEVVVKSLETKKE